MTALEFNDDVYFQLVTSTVSFSSPVLNISDYLSPRKPSKLDLAKKWLKDNGGAHPGCLDRFMQARGMK